MENSIPERSSQIKDSAPYTILILLLSVMAFVYTFNPKLGYLSDCARYYLVGQSVAAGAGFTQIWDVMQQPDGLSSPLYPLFIALLSVTLSGSILFIKSINGLFLVGSVTVFFYFYRKMKFNYLSAFVILLPLIFNYWVLKHSSIMLTEIPFIFLSGMSLFLFSRSKDGTDLKDFNWWSALLFAVSAYYMRSIGIVLAAAIVMDGLLKKRWKRAVVSALFFSAAFAPWIIRGVNLSGQTHIKIIRSINPLLHGGEKAGLIDFVERIGVNLINYISGYLPASVIPTFQQFYGSESIIGWIAGLSLTSGIVYGFIRLKSQKTIVGLYISLYLMILLIFPSVYTGQRFLLPLLPLFYPLIYISIRSLSEYIKLPSKVSPGFMLLLGVINLFSLKPLEAESSKPLLPQWNGYFETAKWANKNLPADAVIAVRVGEEFYLYSLRRTLSFPFIGNPDGFMAYLQYYNVTHLLSDDLDYPLTDMRKRTMPYLRPAMEKNPDSFREVYRTKGGETLLFEIIKFEPITGIEDKKDNN